jgi:hypothetical protein
MEILIVQPVDSIGKQKKSLVGDVSTHPKQYESQFQIITRGTDGTDRSTSDGCEILHPLVPPGKHTKSY